MPYILSFKFNHIYLFIVLAKSGIVLAFYRVEYHIGKNFSFKFQMVNWANLTQMRKSDISVKETASETNETQNREGRYADVFRIGHSAYKFVLEFGQESFDSQGAFFHTRVIVGPDKAKEFFRMFDQIIKQHEEQFGCIHDKGKE